MVTHQTNWSKTISVCGFVFCGFNGAGAETRRRVSVDLRRKSGRSSAGSSYCRFDLESGEFMQTGGAGVPDRSGRC